jgi:acyl carrier protein
LTTLDRLRALLVRDFEMKAEALTAEATLESLEIDSLRMIEIVFCVEDEFKITAPGDAAELRKLTTFGDLAAYVDAVVGGRAPP